MIKVLLLIFASSAAAYQSFSLGNDGSYQFFYKTGEEAGSQLREESRDSDGVVVGRYSYQDPTGEIRVVNYRADNLGYVAEGDVGVPGAPQAQVPTENDKKEQTSDDEGDNQTEPPSDTSSDASNETKDSETEDSSDDESSSDADDEYEDDVKAMKLQEPSYDGPPEGFPIGFFDHSFQSLRRLPEPSKDEEDSESKDNASTDGKNAVDQDQQENSKTQENPALKAFFPFYHHHPHVGPIRHTSENILYPYQYAYHHPDGYGYYYVF